MELNSFFKVFIGFVEIWILFYVFGFFGCEACGISAPQPGIKPAPLVLEVQSLTTEVHHGSPYILFKQRKTEKVCVYCLQTP